jgi:hypothetical protein
VDNECLKQVKERIDFDAWCGRNSLNESLFIHKFFIAASCIKNWQLHRQVPIDVAGMPHCIQSMWRNPEGDPEALLRFDIYECDSHTAAHEFLVHFISEFQSAEVYRSDDGSVGDVMFVPKAGQALIFIRGNLLVFLANAGRSHASLTEIARDLDEKFTVKAISSDLEAAGHILGLSLAESTLSKGTVAPLKLELEKHGDQPFYYKFFCSIGEVFIKQGRLSYQAAIVGEPTIDVYVTGETGFFEHQQLRLTVTP